MLEVIGVHAHYGHIEALHGVSVRVERGQIVTIIGANGAGKSTLLMTISGSPKPSAGEIVFEGQRLNELEPHEIVAAPDGRKAWVACAGSEGVAVIDLRRNAVVKTIAHEQLVSPHGMAISADGRRLLVTSAGSRRLFLVDAARGVRELKAALAEGAP